MKPFAKRAIDVTAVPAFVYTLATIFHHSGKYLSSNSDVPYFLLDLAVFLLSGVWICMRVLRRYPRLSGVDKHPLIDENRMDIDIVTIMSKNYGIRREQASRATIIALVPLVICAILLMKVLEYLHLDQLLAVF